MANRNRGYFEKHAKSSAALVSLAIHAALVVVALSFVAVTVIQKTEQVFEAKPVKRPKMQLKKLQVPVNIKKKQTQKPKLRKRIVVKPKVNQNMPDIKMPEVTGVKGGLGGAAGDGLGGGCRPWVFHAGNRCLRDQGQGREGVHHARCLRRNDV